MRRSHSDGRIDRTLDYAAAWLAIIAIVYITFSCIAGLVKMLEVM